MNLFRSVSVYLLASVFSFHCCSQALVEDFTVYSDSTMSYVELSGLGSTNSRTPFWIQSNQFGTVSRVSPAGTVRGQLEYTIPIITSRGDNAWRIITGVEGVANLSQSPKLLLPQAHLTLKFRNWELFAGRKKQYVGLADSTLGTGSYIWSGNAMPIPKIQLGTTKFVSVPFTSDWVSFHGFYSEGLFENTRPVTSELKLHQKALYLRVGKTDSRIRLYGGFNHQVQWGGKSPYETNNGTMSRGLHNYLNLVTGRSGAAPSTGSDSSIYFDNHNRVGNHLGTLDLGMEIETYDNTWFFYRQSIYEDGTLYALGNIADGLNGIRLRRKNLYSPVFSVKEVVVEFLYTKSQGGPKFNLGDSTQKRGALGRDNYFNNFQVRDGWSYYDRTIGTPFITPTSDTKHAWPVFGNLFTSNNRVAVAHVGLSGSLLQQFDWTTKLSFSSNIGTYDGPFPKTANQFSGYLSMQAKLDILGGATIKASIAADVGNLYPKTYGLTLALRKEFSIE